LYDQDGQPVPTTAFGGESFPYIAFTNHTFSGSRIYLHRINIFPNVIDGQPSTSLVFDSFQTSTYEKDGSTESFPAQFGLIGGSDEFQGNRSSSTTYPVGENAIFGTSYSGGDGSFLTESFTCLDDNCDRVSSTQESFLNGIRTVHSIAIYLRIATEVEWISIVQEAYANYTVPPAIQVNFPIKEDCGFNGNCITEERWCTQDPNCSPSPYQEPDAKMKGGWIAFFVIIGGLFAAAIGLALHSYFINKQAKRYRTKFAQRVAENINIRASARSLPAAALADEFKRIDKESPNGRISKEALWEFLNSGKAGEMSKSDFDALWAVMDADRSGSVDFLEFCAFMGKCHEEYNQARADRGSIAERSSSRILFATTSARLLTKSMEMVAKVDDDKMEKLEEEKEPDEDTV